MEVLFDKTLKQLENIQCLTPALKRGNGPDIKRFMLRGTRIGVKLSKINGHLPVEKITLQWSIKSKRSPRYELISFEDVLNSNLVSQKYKEELLFHLDLFA